ncbi:flagellar protein FlgN [Paenibacillus alkalitolerans]|uniref:flagellar protein FlgN n=1 Tax=Paenibacillus alkalitolerans TaxID=2799335 RepID=UPI0018F56033|nr:flagellar protein FlgN [Paenibacillus alkalitolerans]
MPVQQLIGILGRLAEAHEALLDLAEQKKAALIHNEVDKVSATVNKETKIMRSVDDLLKEQADSTNAFFRSRGLQPARAISVTELSRLVFEPDAKEALLSARDRLTSNIERLAAANQLNQQLIQQSLAFVNYSIDLVLGPDEEPVYRNPASNNSSPTKRAGYFDSKA